MTMVCAPVVASDHETAAHQLTQAQAAGVDLVELRLDLLTEPPRLPWLLEQTQLPVIVTCRAAREGGGWKGSEPDRLALLQQAIDLGAAYVDVEHEDIATLAPSSKTKIIASYHNFDETPANIDEIVERLTATSCDIIKWATMATTLEDNVRCLALIEQASKPAIGLCMGEYGEMSRVLCARSGAFLTFGALASGCESAPGQLLASDLLNLYRIKKLSSTTAVYAVVGDPIAHSMSPQIHNRAFAKLGLDAVYVRCRVHDFERFLSQVADPIGIQGLSVTLPHKGAALAASAELASLAQKIGAVNTLSRPDKSAPWEGMNTDCEAAMDAIIAAAARADVCLSGAKALLLGAGGTARALGFGLLQAGCQLTIANRTRSKAEALASDLKAEVIDFADIQNSTYAVIANTTSVGMHPNGDSTPIDASAFHSGMVVFDAVYNPRPTRMLKEAGAAGAQKADGLDMFVGQAARQFERWTETKAPRDVMEAVVLKKLGLDC